MHLLDPARQGGDERRVGTPVGLVGSAVTNGGTSPALIYGGDPYPTFGCSLKHTYVMFDSVGPY